MRRRLLWIVFIPIFVLIAFGLGSVAQVMLESLRAPAQVDLAQRFYSASERELWERFVANPPPVPLPRVKSPPWHMKSVMMRWKTLPL